MEKVFFEYSENSVMLYDALKNANPPSDMVTIFNKFQKQLYSYSEFEIKHFKKLQPFAENKQLVNFVCDLLNKVCPHYENKEFYYILVVLSYSKEQKAMEYLDLLTAFAIANELNLCHILLTIFNETGSPQVLSNCICKVIILNSSKGWDLTLPKWSFRKQEERDILVSILPIWKEFSMHFNWMMKRLKENFAN